MENKFDLSSLPIGGIVGGAFSIYQMLDAKRRLAQMGPRPNINIEQGTTDWMNKMVDRSKFGLTGDQKAGMYNDVARGENTAYNRGMNVMGNTGSGALMTALNATNIAGRLRIGQMDASAQDQHVREASPWIQYYQGLKNQQQNNKMQDWDRQAGAYGQEGKAGMTNLVQTAQDFDTRNEMHRGQELQAQMLGLKWN